MKTAKLLSVLFFCLTISTFAQTKSRANRAPGPDRYDETVYVFKTYEDYKAGKMQAVGHFEGYTWGNMGMGAKIKVKGADGKVENLKDSDGWGFKIDKYVFRALKNEYPVVLIGQKEKCFYLNGAFYLDMIYRNIPSGGAKWNHTDNFFFADDENSKLFELDKLKKEKDNPAFAPLFDCIKKAKKGTDESEELNATYECIKAFVN